MGKATTLPDGVKKSQVVLTTYDEDTDTTKVVTRDGKNYFSKYGSNWSEEDPNGGGHAPKYDPAQEENIDPEQEGEGEENENVAEGRAPDQDDDDAQADAQTGVDEPEAKPVPPKSEAELKAEAAASKAANARTAAAQKIAASEGGPVNDENELLNRQARLAGEGVTNQAPVDGGPGGTAKRTLTKREIELLEGSEAAKAARQAARPGIDNELPPEGSELPGKPNEPPLGGSLALAEKDEEIAALKSEIGKLKQDLMQKNAMVAKYQVAMRGKFEGPPMDESAPSYIAPSPMAGAYPHNTSEMPTVDEINARNGQPESAPRTLSNSKRRDAQGYPIASEQAEAEEAEKR